MVSFASQPWVISCTDEKSNVIQDMLKSSLIGRPHCLVEVITIGFAVMIGRLINVLRGAFYVRGILGRADIKSEKKIHLVASSFSSLRELARR